MKSFNLGWKMSACLARIARRGVTGGQRKKGKHRSPSSLCGKQSNARELLPSSLLFLQRFVKQSPDENSRGRICIGVIVMIEGIERLIATGGTFAHGGGRSRAPLEKLDTSPDQLDLRNFHIYTGHLVHTEYTHYPLLSLASPLHPFR